MNLEKLSLERLSGENIRLANLIKQDFNPDLVIYIAKGGYIIGRDISRALNAKLIEVHAARKGNHLKKMLAPLLVYVPQDICNYLRKIELRTSIHNVNSDRCVFFPEKLSDDLSQKSSKILIVDDSVDTGNSVKAVKEKIFENFTNIEDVRVAALNVWSKSLDIVKTDYYIWRDTILVTPMSKDSSEYRAFLELYNKHKFGGGK